MEYADDVTWATTGNNIVDMIKEIVPPMFKEAAFHVNHTNTEEYAVPFPPRTPVLTEHSYTKHPAQRSMEEM